MKLFNTKTSVALLITGILTIGMFTSCISENKQPRTLSSPETISQKSEEETYREKQFEATKETINIYDQILESN